MKPKNIEIDMPYAMQPIPKNSKIAILGIIIFVLLTLISLFLYPNYDMLKQTLSELGIGTTSILFNSGVALGGLLLIPFFISQYKHKDFLAQLICFLGVATSITFIGIGLFPLSQPEIHTFIATLFFTLVTITATIIFIHTIQINIRKKPLYPFELFLYFLLNAFAVGITLTYLIMQTPAWQKIAILGIIIWLTEWIIIKEN